MITQQNSIRKTLCAVTAAVLVATLTGCSLSGGPRARWGFTPQVGFGDPDNLGTHSYGLSGSEGFGIFYTLRGGSIDLDHLRGAADLTRCAYDRAYAALRKGGSGFSLSPAFEWTTNKVKFTYPDNWDTLSQAEKDEIARKAALIVAPVVGFDSTIWHEMITWEGTHFMLFEPEFTSAFSWDDLYSNLSGVDMALEIVSNGYSGTADYNQKMTDLIAKEFQRLQVVPKDKAIAITKSVDGTWYAPGKLMKRNMDIGTDDGMVTPSIIPGYTDEPPISKPAPTLDGLADLGIGITYTISSAYFENGKLKKIAGSKGSVQPVRDYPTIMKKIEQEAINKYGYMIR